MLTVKLRNTRPTEGMSRPLSRRSSMWGWLMPRGARTSPSCSDLSRRHVSESLQFRQFRWRSSTRVWFNHRAKSSLWLQHQGECYVVLILGPGTGIIRRRV